MNMKKVITLLLAVAPIISNARDCKLFGEFANYMMKSRQEWATPVDLANGITDEIPVLQEIALSTFDTPKFSTKEYQIAAAKDFQSKWELACLRGEIDFSKKKKK